jgi:hypothetical protein
MSVANRIDREKTAIDAVPRAKRGITAPYKLEILSERKGNHSDLSAFFARRKCTLEEAYQFVHGLMGLVFVYKVRVLLWSLRDTPEKCLWCSLHSPSSINERQAKRTPTNGEDKNGYTHA